MLNLPVEILYLISDYLDIPSIYNLSSTCKDMREVMRHYRIIDTNDMAQRFHQNNLSEEDMYKCFENNYTWLTPHYYLAAYLKYMIDDHEYDAYNTIKRVKQCFNLFMKISYDYRLHHMLAGICGASIRSCETLYTMKGYKKKAVKQMNKYLSMLDKLRSIPMTMDRYTGPKYIFMRDPGQQQLN